MFTPKNCDPFGLQVNRTRRTPLSSVVPEPTFICNKPRALCFQRGQIPAGHYLYRVVGYSQLRDSHRSVVRRPSRIQAQSGPSGVAVVLQPLLYMS